MTYNQTHNTMKSLYFILATIFSCPIAAAQISITIDAKANNHKVSPYLYGRNGVLNNEKADIPTDVINKSQEAGIHFIRQNEGNNATKYNWKKKITSHPDWYNNVYDCDWDRSATNLQAELPDAQVMFGFQLIGKAASSKAHNFNDWAYNKSQWGIWCTSNMCGGGSLDASGNVISKGDPALYLQDWPADSTVEIYTHWRDDLGLDMSKLNYWNMDNEMEIWNGTHDDVYPEATKEMLDEAIDHYVETAKAIRAINPDVKLCGPNAANEWSWFKCGNANLKIDGKYYCWLEYFIKRVAEAEKAEGISLIDVFDIHFYPEDASSTEVLQCHRVLFDRDFEYSKANGIKTMNGGWDNNLKKEYIFGRCQDWIDQYFGPDRGITFAMGEHNIKSQFSPAITAISYASFIGEGMKNGMEYFTPWTWQTGMWETVHLFSRYNKNIYADASSSDEAMVSAYPTINEACDSMTITLVNRNEKNAENITIDIQNFTIKDGTYYAVQFANLPTTETFISHTENALKKSEVSVKNNRLAITLPALSATSIQLKSATSSIENECAPQTLIAYPNPAYEGHFHVTNNGDLIRIEVVNVNGQIVRKENAKEGDIEISTNNLPSGIYLIRAYTAEGINSSTIIVK